jgi:hypothetical protein
MFNRKKKLITQLRADCQVMMTVIRELEVQNQQLRDSLRRKCENKLQAKTGT